MVGTVLAKVGTAKQVVAHLSGVTLKKDGNIEVVGKGTPIIYINNKMVRDPKELDRIKSADVQKVEVLTSPGAKYDANVSAVIRIMTLKKKDEGWTFDIMSQDGYSYQMDMSLQIGVGYRKGKLETMANIRYDLAHAHSTTSYDIATHVDSLWQQKASTTDKTTSQTVSGSVAFNYSFSPTTSMGAQYEFSFLPSFKTNSHNLTDVLANQQWYDAWNTNEKVWMNGHHTHLVSAYLNGMLWKCAFRLDGSVLMGDSKQHTSLSENSERYDDYTASTAEHTTNRLYALKYVMEKAYGVGNLSWGTECTFTRRHSDFSGYVGVLASTDDDIHDNNLAVFADWQISLGEHSKAGVGLRYEHVTYDYFDHQVKSDEGSKVYNYWFPTLSFSSCIGQLNYSFDYHVRSVRPAYEMLKSAVNYGNRLTYMSGTPNLQPTYIYELGMNVAYKDFNVRVGHNYYKDDIFFDIEQLPGNEKISVNKFVNHPSRNELVTSLDYAPTFGVWQPSVGAVVNYQWLTCQHLGEDKCMNGFLAVMKWDNAFRLPSAWILRLDGMFSPAGKSQNRSVRLSGTVNASVFKEWGEGKYSLMLEATDLFKTQREASTMYFLKTKTYNVSHSNTRGISLTFRYQLSGKKNQYKGSGAGEEERQRLL